MQGTFYAVVELVKIVNQSGNQLDESLPFHQFYLKTWASLFKIYSFYF